MILTGKAREDFLKWVKKRCNIKIHELIKIEMWFDIQDDAFKNALIIEWFDSVGIYIELNRFTHGLKFNFWYYVISDFKGVHLNSHLENKINTDSRQEAIKQAIIKANEIYNERNTI